MDRTRHCGGLAVALVMALAGPMAARAQAGYGPGSGMMGPGMGPGMMGRGAPQGGAGTAGASPSAGAQIFAGQCAMCHSLRADAPPMVGPDLHGLIGRRAGTAPGFAYSAALRESGVAWNDRTLDAFLAAPQSFIPGNRMQFAGIASAAERRALIGYLQAPQQ
jgi:cytochrome c